MDCCDTEPEAIEVPEAEEEDHTPMGFDPRQAEKLCSCGGKILDLGVEQPDKWTSEKRWYLCESCRRRWSEVLSPPHELPHRSDLAAWKRRIDAYNARHKR